LDIFNPTWPSTCPFVTTVGATKLYPGHTVTEGESAANDPAGFPYSSAYSSGGGFSNIYSIPEYQADAVATYFKKHASAYPYYSALFNDTGDIKLLPDVGALAGSTGGIYNRIGRGYPDVSANGDNIAVRFFFHPLFTANIRTRSTSARRTGSREGHRRARHSSPAWSTGSTRSA
jgi:tripeptidyl-peptidase-1